MKEQQVIITNKQEVINVLLAQGWYLLFPPVAQHIPINTSSFMNGAFAFTLERIKP